MELKSLNQLIIEKLADETVERKSVTGLGTGRGRVGKNKDIPDDVQYADTNYTPPTLNPDTLGNQQVAGSISDEALKIELRRQVDAGEITKDTFKNYMDQQTKRVVDKNTEDRKQDLENVAVNAADTAMDIVGMVPGPIGMVADAAHVGAYAVRAQMETDPEKRKELLQRAGMTVLAGIGLPAAVGLAGKGAAKVAPKTATKVATALSGKGALEGGIGGSVAAYTAATIAGAETATSLSTAIGGNIVGSLVGKALANRFPGLVTPLMAKTAEKVAAKVEAKIGTISPRTDTPVNTGPKPTPIGDGLKQKLVVTPRDPKNMSIKDKLAYDKATAESKAANAIKSGDSPIFNVDFPDIEAKVAADKAKAEQIPQNGEKLQANTLPLHIMKVKRTEPGDAASRFKAPTTPPTPKETIIKVGSNLLAQFTLAGQLATAQLPASTFNPSGGAAIKDTSSTFTSPATAPVAPKPSSTSTATETPPTKTPSAETAPAKTSAKATETAPAKTSPKATETTKPKKPDTAPKPKGGGILPIPPLSTPDLKTYAYEDPKLKSGEYNPYSIKLKSNMKLNLNKLSDSILDKDRTSLAGYDYDLQMGRGRR